MFSSLAVDMRVTQLVDGNKGIHAMLPKRYANAPNYEPELESKRRIERDARSPPSSAH